ncbi:MAG TPA: di-heme oxidoredictase family protein, partial [Gemmatimonadales bacterium]|nr:di-heme oxidoredictase family protein [Gemmatimonadales bacterium]
PVGGLSAEELATFVRGDQEFGRRFSPADGLGPIFNNTSCASCHSGDGRGRLENALVRFSLGSDPALALGGPQLQDRAIPGAIPEVLPGGVNVSIRLPPPVFGVGLIEAIPEAAILVNADSADSDADGISGRANWVVAPPWVPDTEPNAGPGPRVGRFSRKAQVGTIFEQVVTAYLQDMGITSDFLPVENRNPQVAGSGTEPDRVPDPEVTAATVRAVVAYVRMLAPPAPGPMTAQRQRGQAVFDSIGCARCHIPVLYTGPSPVAALSNQPVPLYSDLLLHDMGDGLADNRPDRGANGREWRTAPLWGLRLVRQFLNGDAFYLHDGRARTLEEAILLHGGEAQAARDRFASLPAADRAALLDFVGSR